MTSLPLKSTTYDQLVDDTDSSYVIQQLLVSVFFKRKCGSWWSLLSLSNLLVSRHCFGLFVHQTWWFSKWRYGWKEYNCPRSYLCNIWGAWFNVFVWMAFHNPSWSSKLERITKESARFSSMLGSTITNLCYINSRMEFDCNIAWAK